MQKPVAKSLHTVSVLVQVARYVLQTSTDPYQTPEGALNKAMDALFLSGREDPYKLRAAALKQLEPVERVDTSRPGDMAAAYAEENGVSYEQALVSCNMD